MSSQDILLNKVRALVEVGLTWAEACDRVSEQLVEEGLPSSALFIAEHRDNPDIGETP